MPFLAKNCLLEHVFYKPVNSPWRYDASSSIAVDIKGADSMITEFRR